MQTITSANTSINSNHAPKVYGMKAAIKIMEGKSVIDIGGGKYDTAINAAATYGTKVSIYDPYNRTAAHNKAVMKSKYDVAIISNVLNVINDKDERIKVIQLALQKAKIVLITVYEGNKTGIGKQTGKDSWQENRQPDSYVEEIQCNLPGCFVKRQGKLIIVKEK